MNPDTGEWIESELLEQYQAACGKSREEATEDLLGTREAIELRATREQVETLSRRVETATELERARRDSLRRELRQRARTGS